MLQLHVLRTCTLVALMISGIMYKQPTGCEAQLAYAYLRPFRGILTSGVGQTDVVFGL